MENVNTPLSEEQITLAHEVIAKSLSHLRITGTFTLEATDAGLSVLLETEDSGIVIGYHGEGLDGLQLLFSLMVSKKIGHFVRVSVDVGDYRKNRTEYLEQLAQSAKERALESGQEQQLSSLKPWERRVVHLILQDDDQVESVSMGDGKERMLVIRPKNA